MAHYSDDSIMERGKRYPSLKSMVEDLSDILIPPERISVPESSEKNRIVYNPPAYHGPWDNSIAPYLIEPMLMLDSREHTAVCVVAPAQSLKTEIILNWAQHSITTDPSDMMIVEKIQSEARAFSKLKLDRMIKKSPAVKEKLIQRRSADNTFDKEFKTGTSILIGWPTEGFASGKSVRRVGLTDYDRMVQDLGGEGSPFDLFRRRTTTYKRLGMTYVESSPSFDVLDPSWKPNKASPHEAPPCEGILGIYNRGDRRRRYWQCPHCGNWFEPGFNTLRWPDSADPVESAENAFMACPHCFEESGAIIRQSDRIALDAKGVWLRDGEKIDSEGNRYGVARRSDIASFWIKGPCTAFGQWKTMVLNLILANEEYNITANDRPLKTTINTDQGEAYTPPHIAQVRAPEDLMERALPLPEKTVPRGVVFLVATIDVQKNSFVVQVHGVIPAEKTISLVVIDRFSIVKSARLDEDGERYWVNPGSYLEDWDLIGEKVIKKNYPIEDLDFPEKPRHMAIRAVACDSGGRDGVTSNAYSYYRKLREDGLAGRFFLVKGDTRPNAPRVSKTYPDSQRKDRTAGARGEIPVLMLNTNTLKDWLDKALGRVDKGGGHIQFPDWLDLKFYKELCVEVKTNKGWENPKSLRQESWDLLVYCYAICIHLGAERFNWDNPPVWAGEWNNNPLIAHKDELGISPGKKDAADSKSRLVELAKKLG